MLGRRKPVETLLSHAESQKLKPSLSWPHLVAMGVGAIVGVGIYALIGQATRMAGPAVLLSFTIAGAVCVLSAFCYAELATALPASGSAYTYSYVALGERIAWVIGWSLVLEYTVSCAVVAIGWSGHLTELFAQFGIALPHQFLSGPFAKVPGILNIPAVFVSVAVTCLLLLGAREGATVNLVLVLLKLAGLTLFIVLTIGFFRADHLQPFMPNGFGDPLGFFHAVPGQELQGVMPAAALIFFAFYGFDAVASSAEETRNPARDLTIGILGSMALCTALYIGVAVCAIGAVDYHTFSATNVSAPLVKVLETLDLTWAANLLAIAVIVAVPTVIMVMMYGQTRVFFVMARDGLLPSPFTRVHARRGVPTTVTIVIGGFIALVSGLFDLGELASVANAGTLAAFISVAASVLVLRRSHPNLTRKFRTPAAGIVAPLAIIGCAYLFISLQLTTLISFAIWNAIGLVIYFAYSAGRSRLNRAA